MSTTVDPSTSDVLMDNRMHCMPASPNATAETGTAAAEMERSSGDGSSSVTHRSRQAFIGKMQSLAHSSTSSSSESMELPFVTLNNSSNNCLNNCNNEDEPGTAAAGNGVNNKARKARKCFLIDSLLEERQKRLAAAAAAAAAIKEINNEPTIAPNSATNPTDEESDVENENSDIAALLTTEHTIKSENDGELVEDPYMNFFPSDPTPSSTAASSTSHALKSEEDPENDQTQANLLNITAKFFGSLNGTNETDDVKNLLIQHNLRMQQGGTNTDYTNCLRTLQSLTAGQSSISSAHLPQAIENPLLLLQMMSNAIVPNFGATLAKQQQQQQQTLMLHQQAALALRSRVAALLMANNKAPETNSATTSKRIMAPDPNSGASKSYAGDAVVVNTRTAAASTSGSGRTRSGLPHRSSNAKKYRCDICDKTFSRSNTLITHKRIHTGEKPFRCGHCGRAFRQPGNLTRHAYTHSSSKPFVCGECGKAFNRASNLHTHIRTHNINQNPSNTNSTAIRTQNSAFVLPNQFDANRQLSLLLERAAAGVSTVANLCATCGKYFANRLELRSHQCQDKTKHHRNLAMYLKFRAKILSVFLALQTADVSRKPCLLKK